MNPKYAKEGKTEDRVIEECSELVMAICKAKRFGIDNYHPDRPQTDNRMDILAEIKDVKRLISEYEKELLA